MNQHRKAVRGFGRLLFLGGFAAVLCGFSAPREASAQCMAQLAARSPYQSGREVVSIGAGLARGICPAARVDLSAQTKVCGFWGCNWQTKKVISAYPNGATLVAKQGCRSGTNRYRTRVNFCWMPLSWPPTYDCNFEYIPNPQPEFRC